MHMNTIPSTSVLGLLAAAVMTPDMLEHSIYPATGLQARSLLACVISTKSGATPGSHGGEVPECTCTCRQNDFPKPVADTLGTPQGWLSETLSCAANDPGGQCTVSGNVTWTPGATCCETQPGTNWSRTYSGSADLCVTAVQLFTNCSSATSNYHSCSKPCDWPATVIWVVAGVSDCTPTSLSGTVSKTYDCYWQQ